MPRFGHILSLLEEEIKEARRARLRRRMIAVIERDRCEQPPHLPQNLQPLAGKERRA